MLLIYVRLLIGKSCAPKIQTGTLGVYINKEREYWRYSYREGDKIFHKHLCPVSSPNQKIELVREALAAKKPVREILKLI